MDGLSSKIYAITGGNSGIGRATAGALMRQGARVAVFGRNEQALALAQRELDAVTLAVQYESPWTHDRVAENGSAHLDVGNTHIGRSRTITSGLRQASALFPMTPCSRVSPIK
jgi:NAD(P)-dependent dehydrogenase (short-subunit alcohol dehydrogenase family)